VKADDQAEAVWRSERSESCVLSLVWASIHVAEEFVH
jgi:hypothetical protein